MEDKIVSLKQKHPKMTIKAIAAKVGVHVHRVYKVLNEKLPGWTKYNGKPSRVPLILKLRRENPDMGASVIAGYASVSVMRVRQVLDKHMPGWNA